MIALIDYGAGNLTSVKKALTYLDAEITVPTSPQALSGCAGVIVPGVGNFEATAILADGWTSAVVDHVRRGNPLLGICLGLQWLFEGSEEAPGISGLGEIAGRCALIRGSDSAEPVKVPHVGWNMWGIHAGASREEGQSHFSYREAPALLLKNRGDTRFGLDFLTGDASIP